MTTTFDPSFIDQEVGAFRTRLTELRQQDAQIQRTILMVEGAIEALEQTKAHYLAAEDQAYPAEEDVVSVPFVNVSPEDQPSQQV